MRFSLLLLILGLLATPGWSEPEQAGQPAGQKELAEKEEETISPEDRELITNLELLELYDLLENMNALAGMEDRK